MAADPTDPCYWYQREIEDLNEDNERLKREVDYWMNLDAAALERENERLHDEIRELKANAEVLVLANQTFTGMFEEMARVTRGWQDAEAQIAVLQARLADALADPIVNGRFAHLESENARLLVELAHRVGWEERALRAEDDVSYWKGEYETMRDRAYGE